MKACFQMSMILFALLLLAPGIPNASAEPADYSVYPHLDHTEYLDGNSNAVVSYSLWGRDFFAVANEESDLHLYEVVSGEVVPRGIGPTVGADQDVAIKDWYAFVATGSGLSVVNVAVPDQPVPAGFINLTGEPIRIALSSNHAFVACQSGGMVIVDITDLQNMSVVGTYTTPTKDVWLDGDRLGIIVHQRFEILDVSVPQNPVLLGSFNMSSHFRHCVLQGNLAYLSSWSQIKQLDISDPTSITLLQDLPLRGEKIGIKSGELFRVGNHHLSFVDFATGTILRQSQQVGDVSSAAIIGGKIMAVGEDRLEFFDDGLRANPLAEDLPEVSLMEVRGIMWGSLIYGLSPWSENTLVAAKLGAADGLRWNLTLQAGGYPLRGMAQRGGTLVAVSSHGKVFVVAVSINGAILQGTVNLLDGFFTPYNQDGTVDFLDEQTVVILDEKYPSSANRNIRVVDIADPQQPVQIGQYPITISAAEHLMVAGSTVVVTSRGDYEIYDATNRLALQSLASHYLGGTAYHTKYARGSYLYALHDRPVSPFGEIGPELLDTWDLSDPEAPALVHQLNLASSGYLVFAGDYAYQAESGLILDLTEPGAPAPCGNFAVPNPSLLDPLGVLADEVTIVTGNLFDGAESSAMFMAAQGATGDASSVGEDLPVAGPELSLQAVPNPFNPRVALQFELSADSRISLGIFDLRGRLVADLGTHYREAGPHTFTWEGVDSGGRDLPSGVYLARVATRNRSAVLKIVLAR